MKKTFLKAAVLLCAGIGMTACGSGKQAVQAIDLTGEWNIVTVNGDTIKAENSKQTRFSRAKSNSDKSAPPG